MIFYRITQFVISYYERQVSSDKPLALAHRDFWNDALYEKIRELHPHRRDSQSDTFCVSHLDAFVRFVRNT